MIEPVLDKIAGKWHDRRAYHFRKLCNEIDLLSHDPRNYGDSTLLLRKEADRAMIKANYHEQMARTYEGGK